MFAKNASQFRCFKANEKKVIFAKFDLEFEGTLTIWLKIGSHIYVCKNGASMFAFCSWYIIRCLSVCSFIIMALERCNKKGSIYTDNRRNTTCVSFRDTIEISICLDL